MPNKKNFVRFGKIFWIEIANYRSKLTYNILDNDLAKFDILIDFLRCWVFSGVWLVLAEEPFGLVLAKFKEFGFSFEFVIAEATVALDVTVVGAGSIWH